MAIAATGRNDDGSALPAAQLIAPGLVRPVVVEAPADEPAGGIATPLTLAPPPLSCRERQAEAPIERATGPWAVARAVMELAKPRITRLVTMTALGGLALSVIDRPWTWWSLSIAAAGCAIGTWLSSGGANALNQCMEVDRDRRMDRTRHRPLPSGRIGVPGGVLASSLMLLTGLLVLWATCGAPAMVVALVTAFTYLAIYTPLKPVTVLNTWVGAVPGALPPLIGWAAGAEAGAGGGGAAWSSLVEPGGWSLVALMAVWQIPHFLALAWLYREDYARGGYCMLPVVDPTGGATVTQVVLWSVLLLPASMSPWLAMPERVGIIYAAVALVTGVWYLWEAMGLIADRSPARARRVFITSVIHLPILLATLAIGVIGAAALRWSGLSGQGGGWWVGGGAGGGLSG